MNDQSRSKQRGRVANTHYSQAVDDMRVPPDFPGSSGIGQRLRQDMDSLFRKDHVGVQCRAGNDRNTGQSAERFDSAPPTANVRICRILNQSIADSLDLQSQCRQARWHLMDSADLEQRSICTQLIQRIEHHVDLLGQRIVQLDGVVESAIGHVAERSGLSEFPAVVDDPESLIEAMKAALWLVSGAMREDCAELSELGDAVSHNLLDQTAGWLEQCRESLESLSPEPKMANYRRGAPIQ